MKALLLVVLLLMPAMAATISTDGKYIIAVGEGLDRVDYYNYDDAAVIQAVLDVSRHLEIGGGRYEIRRTINLGGGTAIIGSGDTILNYAVMPPFNTSHLVAIPPPTYETALIIPSLGVRIPLPWGMDGLLKDIFGIFGGLSNL